MEERVVQGCLCDNVLLPVFSRSFIYDNSASQRGKGYHFALRRCCRHLREHYCKHKNEGYVLLFDFRKFFDNVSHRLCRSLIHSKIEDPELVRITEYFIDAFGSTGLGLGSSVSQVMALSSADILLMSCWKDFAQHLCSQRFSELICREKSLFGRRKGTNIKWKPFWGCRRDFWFLLKTNRSNRAVLKAETYPCREKPERHSGYGSCPSPSSGGTSFNCGTLLPIVIGGKLNMKRSIKSIPMNLMLTEK